MENIFEGVTEEQAEIILLVMNIAYEDAKKIYEYWLKKNNNAGDASSLTKTVYRIASGCNDWCKNYLS